MARQTEWLQSRAMLSSVSFDSGSYQLDISLADSDNVAVEVVTDQVEVSINGTPNVQPQQFVQAGRRIGERVPDPEFQWQRHHHSLQAEIENILFEQACFPASFTTQRVVQPLRNRPRRSRPTFREEPSFCRDHSASPDWFRLRRVNELKRMQPAAIARDRNETTVAQF